MTVRQPIVSVLGHVDHGKTSLLDKIRGTAIQQKEAGGITQQIGATDIPIETIKEICGENLTKKEIQIPGLLFIDTPGHEAFTSIRERGGSISDIAILVIDIMQGVQQQTIESIKILKTFKTPFIVALNKIDLVNGWRINNTTSYIESNNKQNQQTKDSMMEKIYNIMGDLSKEGFDSDLFQNINDYSKRIALVPCSAKTGEGINELLMVVVGLSQRYLMDNLKTNSEGEGKGSIIEVKEVKGLGITMDVILYDGKARTGDTILIGTPTGVKKTKIRAILRPAPLQEMRTTKEYSAINEVSAAAGIKLSCKEMEGAISGMPVVINPVNEEETTKEMNESISQVVFETEGQGVVIKAESIGSLEALIKLFGKDMISIRSANIGDVTRKDILMTASMRKANPYDAVIFAFNVETKDEIKELAKKEGVKIIKSKIIYHLIEEYKKWKDQLRIELEREKLKHATFPAKVQVLNGCIFRASSPCVVGVEVIDGTLKTGYKMMTIDGQPLGEIRELQNEGTKVTEFPKGERGAISITNAKAGKDFLENDYLYTDVSSEDYKKLAEFKEILNSGEKQVLEEIKNIKKRKDSLYGY